MSNLNLPTMTFSALDAQVESHTGATLNLAYATTAEREFDGSIRIRHHGNSIAVLAAEYLWVSNAGWGSSTTRTRLHAILGDNGTGYAVTQKDWDQKLVRRTDWTARDGFQQAHFDRVGDGWVLTHYNGAPVDLREVVTA